MKTLFIGLLILGFAYAKSAPVVEEHLDAPNDAELQGSNDLAPVPEKRCTTKACMRNMILRFDIPFEATTRSAASRWGRTPRGPLRFG
ncbi:hypothetical protein QR680_003847 [Steinernema hermaphroditum]|uniref:Uncharacterized protein n=1 Tax=Steinernema hermaphroditum TaxID=289476 RepID=A0AA39HP17_9BILA|nr:hypothetical protein QR680_003847 [Steinernema hermaphroditum]